MTILISVAIMAFIMIIMAVGVILGRSPLKGSCGGKGGPECVYDAHEQENAKPENECDFRPKGKPCRHT